MRDVVYRIEYATHTLVDVEMGWAIHFGCYKTAIDYRMMVGRGIIIKVFAPGWADMIRAARRVYGQY